MSFVRMRQTRRLRVSRETPSSSAAASRAAPGSPSASSMRARSWTSSRRSTFASIAQVRIVTRSRKTSSVSSAPAIFSRTASQRLDRLEPDVAGDRADAVQRVGVYDFPEHADRRGACIGGGVVPHRPHGRNARGESQCQRHERLEEHSAGEGVAGVLEAEQGDEDGVSLVVHLGVADEGNGLVAGELAELPEVVGGVRVDGVPLVEQLIGKR